ncbi:helix-turn-helix domain-containing protein [Streptomyces iranensis]|uniref:Helix-turn-helix domain protein n=1 Tax=Streptomyces iranensis TaxID=576784 RepID=A0A060ZTI1_9ACTN|nr:helix-turn-helix transcriptional regulator [Streptomyces iranensis]MBP2060894.1 transcriptional regulator with XRE-family HTH domain [Streptomyces iranensis]CDR06357.1 helix-turn-helix domain protein [Streptomyces iranensis]
MSEAKEGQEPPSGAAFLGAEVRTWRMRAELSQRELGLKANYGQQYVAKVEAGERLASPEFAEACDRVFGTPGTFARLRKRASQHGYPDWFVPYVQLERQAVSILDYSATLIMGMLQTPEYAREIFRAVHPRASANEIDAKVERRLRRREVMEKDTPPLLWCILNEACLRHTVGGAGVMAAQLAHLLKAAESPHITIQVLPFAVGAPPAAESFTLLVFDEGPNVLYADTAIAGQLIDSPEAVGSATATYDRLRAAALHPDESLSMIRSVMEEYAR